MSDNSKGCVNSAGGTQGKKTYRTDNKETIKTIYHCKNIPERYFFTIKVSQRKLSSKQCMHT